MKKESHAITLAVIILLSFVTIMSGNLFDKKLELEVNDIVPMDYFAPFDIENTIATEQKKKLAADSVENVYLQNVEVVNDIIANTNLLFFYTQELIDIKNNKISLSYDTQQHLGIEYNKDNINYSQILQQKVQLALLTTQYDLLLNTTIATLDEIQERIIVLLNEIYTNQLHEADIERLDIGKMVVEIGISPIYQVLVEDIIELQLITNLILDEEATEDLKQIAISDVTPVMVVEGEKIIGKGSRITEEAYALLEKSGVIDTGEINNFLPYAGVILGIIIIYFFVKLYLHAMDKAHFLQSNAKNLLAIVYIITLFMARLMVDLDYIFLPFAIGTMIITLLINIEVAIIFHVVIVLVATLICGFNISAILYHLITGIMSIFIIVHMIERKDMIRVAAILGIVHLIVYSSLILTMSIPMTLTIFYNLLYALGIGVFSVIVAGGSLPLWESSLGFVTRFGLLELINPNQPLLKRLLLEATGTYHHSLLVANLAETAADEIGANALLARVGGYYHDIGKLTCGNYFKENQGTINPHDMLEPRSSANIIISHVTSGMELATKYDLPACITDMIIQHHGTGVMQYFYIKAQNAGDDSVKQSDFQYPGPKPQTREAALIMLADVLEATTRSMQHKFNENFTLEDLVRKMVKQKLDEGELSECNLYISDIEKVIQSFTRTLHAMYHQRIEYPEKKEGKK
ncbi:MAG: hypothetical protein BEN19_03950 [Epulopiscium sp. Nuni2H_MBin003]|nr:MAG: hypothetical protein BEN19_03950 [Epulopiscium sp. Nuni2H_MBin003]